jgi:hypothetical protein
MTMPSAPPIRTRLSSTRLALLVVGLLFAVLSTSGQALAFCRTTTCDPYKSCNEDPEQCCVYDDDGCDTNGKAISWMNSCVSYSIHDEPSLDREISVEELSDAVDKAFDNWLSVDCDGSSPSIASENYGPSFCGEPTFNSGGRDGNANVWMFRDGVWPHAEAGQGFDSIDASTLALTTITFNWKTGDVLDADVELNTAQAEFTVGDEQVDVDLDSIVQHESGHFLGLDHSFDREATMASGYNPGTRSPRTLSTDDEEAICATYPEDREVAGDSCQAWGIYSQVCEPGSNGCSLSGRPGRSSGWLAVLAPGLLLIGLGRRRSARPEPEH